MAPQRWRSPDPMEGCRGAIIAAAIVLAILALIIGFWWSFA